MKPFAQLILCGTSALLLASPVVAQTSSDKSGASGSGSSSAGSSSSPSSGSSSSSPSSSGGSSSSGASASGSPSSSAGASTRGKVAVQQQGQTRKQFFDKLDTNGDGSISRAEAQASPALVIVFPDADTNSDGALSVVEFEAVPLANPDGSAVQ
jgi:hypothetical protein